MRRDPVHATLTEFQQQLLAEIFRVIVKEITCDEDKEKLAPGEMGINYKEGTFYIRNPHNGKLFSPNSLEHVKQILMKYTPGTNILNADRINGISFYTRLSELDQLGVNFTPDSVIRQMHAPAVFFGPIEYENYEVLQWPGPHGMCLAYKVSEEHAIIRFYDSDSYIAYEGRYNYRRHMFEGWALSGANGDGVYAETKGGGDTTSVYVNTDINDLFVLTLRITETLNPLASISVNGHDPEPIFEQSGEQLSYQIMENNIIMLIYDKPQGRWILLDSTDSPIAVTMSLVVARMNAFQYQILTQMGQMEANFNAQIAQIRTTYDEKIRQLEESTKAHFDRIDEILANRPGKIDAIVSVYTATSDGITQIVEIEGFDGTVDKLVVNYGQTLLRVDLDYVVVGNGIQFMNDVSINTGEVVQFIVLKQDKPE